jgi:carbonic anhydrase/acetyltransferase-like protein (isoleucine patch superfamily)
MALEVVSPESRRKYYLCGESDGSMGNEYIVWRSSAAAPCKGSSAAYGGGRVSGGQNLSHNGESWIASGGKVTGQAYCCEDALVTATGNLSDSAIAYGEAIVHGTMTGKSRVCGKAVIGAGTIIQENGMVYGNAIIGEDCRILNNCSVSEDAEIGDGVKLEDRVKVFGRAKVYSDVKGFVYISDDVIIDAGVTIVNKSMQALRIYAGTHLQRGVVITNSARICIMPTADGKGGVIRGAVTINGGRISGCTTLIADEDNSITIEPGAVVYGLCIENPEEEMVVDDTSLVSNCPKQWGLCVDPPPSENTDGETVGSGFDENGDYHCAIAMVSDVPEP